MRPLISQSPITQGSSPAMPNVRVGGRLRIERRGEPYLIDITSSVVQARRRQRNSPRSLGPIMPMWMPCFRP